MLEESLPKHATADKYKITYFVLTVFAVTAFVYPFTSKSSGEQVERALRMASPSALLFNGPRAQGSLTMHAIGRVSPQQERSLPAAAGIFPSGVRKLCFSRGNYVYLLSSDGGQLTRVTKGRLPNISPDGKMLAFVEDAATNEVVSPTRIKVANLETNQVIEFESLARLDVAFPRWSHNSTKLAVEGGKEMRVGILDLKNGNMVNVAEKVPALGALGEGLYSDSRNYTLSLDSWAADDKSILCHDLEYLYEIDLEGNLIQKLPIKELVAQTSGLSSKTLFSFSKDKQHILFDTDDPDDSAVYLFNIKSKALNKITPEGFAPDNPQWLPSGSEILFANSRFTKESGYIDDIYMVSLTGGTPTLLIKNASHASFAMER